MENKHVKKENGSHVEGDKHNAITSSVRTERPRNYLFKIKSFSLLLQALAKTKRAKYESLHFDAGGYKWKLSLYPKGDKKRGDDGYISLYLVLADPESLPQGEEIHVIFQFFVYDYLRDNYLVLQDGKEKRYHSLKKKWGIGKLLPLEIFNDPSKGYLVDDCCMFGVEVFLNKNESQGGLSLSKNNFGPYKSTFTWKIDKFSTLPEMHSSEEFSVGGIKWMLQLYLKGDSQAKGNSISLFLCVHDYDSLPCGWNIYAEYKLSILDQRNERHFEIADDGSWFSSSATGWGCPKFLELSDLKDSSRGYIVNDSVVIKVKFKCISVINSLA